jgi:hypothetical protein
MSDEPEMPSHTLCLVISMVVGMFAGSLFMNAAVPLSALGVLAGAFAGLAVELFRRSDERAELNPRAKPQKPGFK